jgi:phosphoglycerate kinase
MNKLSNLKEEDLKGKKVFLRADLDVPLKDGIIKDDSRLRSWLETLNYLLNCGSEVIIGGHLGRPLKEEEKLSLRPVCLWIQKQLDLTNEIKEVPINGLKAWELGKGLVLLENLRFYKEEEEGNSGFAKKLSETSEIYVNDAFSASHRTHASIIGIPQFIPHYAGLRLEKEVETLSKVLSNPKRPLTIIVGGAKIETKLPLVEKMHVFADFVLVGGEIAENDKVLLKVQHEKTKDRKSALLIADLTHDKKDITEKDAENFLQIAQKSETIVWNGPMGLFEEKENEKGTLILSEGLSELPSYIIVGGGDTINFLKEKNLLSKFSFVSMGGGAMLGFLSGEELPGIKVLNG